MKVISSHKNNKINCNRAVTLLCGLLFFCHTLEAAEDFGFRVQNASTTLSGSVYRITAQMQYIFSSKVYDALKNGLPIIIKVDIEIQRPRRFYLWAEDIADLHQKYKLQYHALSKKYRVTNLNTGESTFYQSIEIATADLEQIKNLPMLDKSLLKKDEKYTFRIRAGIDIDAFAVPLRMFAYVSYAWRLTSDWYTGDL